MMLPGTPLIWQISPVTGGIPYLIVALFPLNIRLANRNSIAREKAAERFGPDAKVQRDMLGSFVAHGLTQSEAEAEILFQMYSSLLFLRLVLLRSGSAKQ